MSIYLRPKRRLNVNKVQTVSTIFFYCPTHTQRVAGHTLLAHMLADSKSPRDKNIYNGQLFDIPSCNPQEQSLKQRVIKGMPSIYRPRPRISYPTRGVIERTWRTPALPSFTLGAIKKLMFQYTSYNHHKQSSPIYRYIPQCWINLFIAAPELTLKLDFR